MKKILFLIAAMMLLGYAGAQQVNWHTIEDAAEAKIGSRLYFFDFYTNWCGWCKKMDRETFSDPTVAKILNKYYYPVKFDAESRREVIWNKRIYPAATEGTNNIHMFVRASVGRRAGFPSYAMYRADGNRAQRLSGFMTAKEFVMVLWYYASGDNEKYSFENYQQIFDKEIKPVMEKALK